MRRKRSEDDRRQYLLDLGAKGNQVLKRVEAPREIVSKRVVAAINDHDIEDFDRVATKLLAAFENVDRRKTSFTPASDHAMLPA